VFQLVAVALLGERWYCILADIELVVLHVAIMIIADMGIGVVAVVILTVVARWHCRIA